jgi:histidinol phosphatase-like PHP family hydrolase
VRLSNAQLAELLARAADGEPESSHRRRALQRASRAAFHWPEEAWSLVDEDRSLTELRSVGPWVAAMIGGWLDPDADVMPLEPPEIRRGFLTRAEALATLAGNERWREDLRADLQMHTTYSDGRNSLREMASEAAAFGYAHVAITDHSKGLPIALGMDETRLSAQGQDIRLLNEELARSGAGLRALRSIEMNLTPEGQGDMDPEALSRLDLVLGAFHSKLRLAEDQTDRYLAAIRNPTVHVLAHPRGRRFNVRQGLRADWDRVFAEAAELDKALEVDAFPDRQDLDGELLRAAGAAGVRISIGTDAHSTAELRYMEFGVAAVIRAGISRERILNYLSVDELRRGRRRSGGPRRPRPKVRAGRPRHTLGPNRGIQGAARKCRRKGRRRSANR